MLEAYEADVRVSQGKIVDYKNKISVINTKLSRLKDLYIDGLLDKDTYKKDYVRLQEELGELARLSMQQPTVPAAMNRILSDVDDFMLTYKILPKIKKRELWQSLIRSIELGERPGRGKPYTDITVKFY